MYPSMIIWVPVNYYDNIDCTLSRGEEAKPIEIYDELKDPFYEIDMEYIQSEK